MKWTLVQGQESNETRYISLTDLVDKVCTDGISCFFSVHCKDSNSCIFRIHIICISILYMHVACTPITCTSLIIATSVTDLRNIPSPQNKFRINR